MVILFFNEQLEYYHYLGTILVFGGVYLVKKKSKYEKKNLKKNLLKDNLNHIPIAYLYFTIGIIFIFQRDLLYHPNENNYFR